MTEQICIHVIIEGRVQGVYYRAWTVAGAKERGLKGWVRNRNDGSVEAVFCGAPDVVEDMLLACKDGPPSARVDAIHRRTHEGDVPEDFKQLSNA